MDSESRYELIPPQLGCSVILRQGHLPLTGVTLYLWARQPAPQPYPPPISQWGPQNFSSPACHGCCGTQGCSLRPPPGVMAVGSGPLGLPIRSQRHRIPPSRVSPVPGWGRGVGAGGEAWCSLPRACHMPLLLSRVPFTPDRRQLPAEPGVTSQAPPASWLFSPCRTNSQHPVPSMKVWGCPFPMLCGPAGVFPPWRRRARPSCCSRHPALCRFFLSLCSSPRCAFPSLPPAGSSPRPTGLPALGTPGTQIHAP